MKPDVLISLGAARGIDIAHTVASETNTKGVAARRKRLPEELRQNLEILETAEGKETRTSKPKEWTVAELGFVMGRCPRLPFLAACYSWMGDRTFYGELHRGLTLKSIHMAEREAWPLQVTRMNGRKDYYLEQLADLVLTVDACPSAFVQAPSLFAIVMDVTDRIWGKPLFGHFVSLQGQYQRWLDEAFSRGARRLRNREETVAAA